MSLATVGAFAIGEYPEGVAVMLFYQVGEAFQRLAVHRSRKAISELTDLRPDYANLKTGGQVRKVAPEEVCVGAHIIVKPGERIPLDGRVVEGRSALDVSALTGEALPRDVEPGSEVFSGSINKNGVLTVEVSKEFGESAVSRILELVQDAGDKKAPTESFITKFAKYYTPFVVFAALALAVLPPLLLPGATFADWINRALVFLVVSCPCALVISIPLGFFGGIGGASRNGILIKGGRRRSSLTWPRTPKVFQTIRPPSPFGRLTDGRCGTSGSPGRKSFRDSASAQRWTAGVCLRGTASSWIRKKSSGGKRKRREASFMWPSTACSPATACFQTN